MAKAVFLFMQKINHVFFSYWPASCAAAAAAADRAAHCLTMSFDWLGLYFKYFY